MLRLTANEVALDPFPVLRQVWVSGPFISHVQRTGISKALHPASHRGVLMSRSVEDAVDQAGSMELIGDPGDKPEDHDEPNEDKDDQPDLEAKVAQLEGQLAAEREKSSYWRTEADTRRSTA